MIRLNSRISVRIGVMCTIAALLFGYVTAKPAVAQVLYGSMVGAIEDQTGAAVPKATVTITNKDTGLTRATAADDQGRYSLLNVQAGTGGSSSTRGTGGAGRADTGGTSRAGRTDTRRTGRTGRPARTGRAVRSCGTG